MSAGAWIAVAWLVAITLLAGVLIYELFWGRWS